MTQPDYKKLCQNLIIRLQWYINEDDVNENLADDNEFWIQGKHSATQAIADAEKLLEHLSKPAPTKYELEHIYFNHSGCEEQVMQFEDFCAAAHELIENWGNQQYGADFDWNAVLPLEDCLKEPIAN